MESPSVQRRHVEIFLNRVLLDGDIALPADSRGLIIFAHDGHDPTTPPKQGGIESMLHQHRFATLSLELLTEYEKHHPIERHSSALLERRLRDVTHWVEGEPEGRQGPIGYYATGVGSVAALRSAAVIGERIGAVVLYRGRPDLVGSELLLVRSPTLLLVPEGEDELIALNREAYQRLCCKKHLRVIPSGLLAGYSTAPWEEQEGERELAEELSAATSEWFSEHMGGKGQGLRGSAEESVNYE
jgi:hypothetical protein